VESLESRSRVETSEVARHIARVAARLFAARGYDATSVREIVEAAGVTKPTLYYHYRSKEGLAQALLTVPMTRFLATLREILERPGDPAAQLERSFQVHFDFCREDPDRARFVYALLFGPLGSGLAAELARFGEEMTAVMTATVRPLAAAGRIAADRVDDCAMACRGMIVIATMDFLYRGVDLDPGLAGRLVGDLLHGFGAGGAATAGRE
jgi:AcrR family transcriptional regulator